MGEGFAALNKLQWKLRNSVPAIEVFFTRNQVKTKKRSSPEIKVFFFLKSCEDQKKGLHRNIGPLSAGICRIYSCWLALDCFIIQRSNLDGRTLTLNGGGRVPMRPPNNLSTDRNYLYYFLT